MKLKELREKYHFTQNEVATKLNLQTQTYQNYELQKREPSIKMLIELADFYHTSIDYLVGRETETINLNTLNDREKRLIKSLLTMNELQQLKTEAYFNGLLH